MGVSGCDLAASQIGQFRALIVRCPQITCTHLPRLNYRSVVLSFAWLLLLIVMEGPWSRDYHQVYSVSTATEKEEHVGCQ